MRKLDMETIFNVKTYKKCTIITFWYYGTFFVRFYCVNSSVVQYLADNLGSIG